MLTANPDTAKERVFYDLVAVAYPGFYNGRGRGAAGAEEGAS